MGRAFGFLTALTVMLALLAGASDETVAQTGAAPELTGFKTPTGNIHCMLVPTLPSGESPAVLRCDLQKTDNRPPARPKSCDLEWGKAFEVPLYAVKGARVCAGDTVADEKWPVLPYGAIWQREGFSCLSEQTGLTCFNIRRAGFTLSRAQQSLF